MTLMTDQAIPTITMGLRLELARRKVGQSQAEFAGTIGLSRSTISDLECDVRSPKRATLIAWSQLTAVPLSWLETGIATVPGGDGGDVVALPRLDSNQQPSGYRPRLLRAA